SSGYRTIKIRTGASAGTTTLSSSFHALDAAHAEGSGNAHLSGDHSLAVNGKSVSVTAASDISVGAGVDDGYATRVISLNSGGASVDLTGSVHIAGTTGVTMNAGRNLHVTGGVTNGNFVNVVAS